MIHVTKTGTANYPWQAICTECKGEETYLIGNGGAVAFGTRGVGNRTWRLAMHAAACHWNRKHRDRRPPCTCVGGPHGGYTCPNCR